MVASSPGPNKLWPTSRGLEANIIFVADVAGIVRGAKFSCGAIFTPHGKFTKVTNDYPIIFVQQYLAQTNFRT